MEDKKEIDIKAIVEDMNQSISMGSFSSEDIEFLKEWFEVSESFLWDDEGKAENNFKNLLDLTAKYKDDYLTKKLLGGMMHIPQPDNKHVTVSDLQKRNKDRLLKVWIDLTRLGMTEKGKELKDMIDDYLENQNDYFPKGVKINANIDEIRKFLQSLKLDLSIQKDYLNHFILTK